MGNLNRCEFIGRLAADPEVRVIHGGKAVINFRLAVNTYWKDRQSGERKEHTEYIAVEAWGATANQAQRLLTKGRGIWVFGRMKTRRWEKEEGDVRYTTTIVCEQFQLLGTKPASATPETTESDEMVDETLVQENGDSTPEEEEEIPF